MKKARKPLLFILPPSSFILTQQDTMPLRSRGDAAVRGRSIPMVDETDPDLAGAGGDAGPAATGPRKGLIP